MAVAVVLASVAAVSVGWWTLLKLRLLPKKVATTFFTLSILWLVTVSAVGTTAIDFLRRVRLIRKTTSNNWCSIFCSIVFRTAFFTNPQVRIHLDESEVKWSSVPLCTCMLLNHTSFLDSLAFTSAAPLNFIYNARTLMKSSLRKLPIFGGVFDRVGHFPVYFKSDENGSFSVDKERQAEVTARVQEHINNGGRITLFPEGQMNKNPSTLLPFRHGTFSTAMTNNMEVYYIVGWGNDKIWPVSSSVPVDAYHDIYFKIGRIGLAKEGEDSAAFAARVQGIVQNALDIVAAKADSSKKAN